MENPMEQKMRNVLKTGLSEWLKTPNLYYLLSKMLLVVESSQEPGVQSRTSALPPLSAAMKDCVQLFDLGFISC